MAGGIMAHMMASTSNFFSSMTNPRTEIRHGEWFYREYQGAEFRARYYDWGFTFSNIEFQIKVYTRFKKWIFFGPNFYWKEALGERIVKDLFIIKRRTSYDTYRADENFNSCVKRYLLEVEDVKIENLEDDEPEFQEIF